MSRKVYILNKGTHDYSGAEKFGELVFCTEGLINKTDVNQMYLALHEVLQDSEYDDLILMSSLTSLCSVASGYMAHLHGCVNYLIYDGGKYQESHIDYEIYDN